MLDRLYEKRSQLLNKLAIIEEMIAEDGGDAQPVRRSLDVTPRAPQRQTKIVDRGGGIPTKILEKSMSVDEKGRQVETVVEEIN